MSDQEQPLPILLFLLEHNKFAEIIKIILSESLSTKRLREYGSQGEKKASLKQQHLMNMLVNRYTLTQLIYLKGSNHERIKCYVNVQLLQAIRKRLRLQLPSKETRKKLWPQFTQIYTSEHFYENLKQLELATEFQVSIQKDINRTFKTPEVKAKTEEVLGVFAQYNPYIGYCQGMNSIIAFLIDDGFTCEEAFFIFKKITEEILPCEYYNNMDSIMTYMRIFYQMLQFTYPKSYQKMKKISNQLQNSYIAMVSFVFQWFVCLFCNDCIDIEITRVIWDFFLVQGIVVLFKAGIAFFHFLEPHILKCESYEAYNEMQKNCIRMVKDSNYFRQTFMNMFISPDILFILKEKLMQQKNIERTRELSDRKIGNIKTMTKKCNKKWNVCLQTLQNNLKQHHTYQCFVFRRSQQVQVIPDFLLKLHRQYFQTSKNKSLIDELKIGRIEHTCFLESDRFTQDSFSQYQSQINLQTRKKYTKSAQQNKSPYRVAAEQNIRKKAVQKIQQIMKTKKGLQRSESMIFMEQMVRNVSSSNLLEYYQVDELFQ